MKFTRAEALEICRRIRNGDSILEIGADPRRPSASTIHKWIHARSDFAQMVAEAREQSGHALRERARLAAVDARNDWMERRGKDGQPIGWQLNGDAVARSKLIVDQLWREAEVLQPRVFGRRQTVEHTGVVGVALADASDQDLIAELMELMSTGRVKLPGGFQLLEVDDEEPIDLADEDDFSDIA